MTQSADALATEVLVGASASSFEYCNRDSMLLRPTLDIFEYFNLKVSGSL
jgi:hypothetical protein